ncbi:unnamed protein product [Arctia plantaginis]|uniref:Uncharacterized protein n=1 Tax=Arctia plantaginis TaxID=874455 RepID=A0A8S0ZP11_ARCPL|nr:unnamed protein product [Arctia plantaginis]
MKGTAAGGLLVTNGRRSITVLKSWSPVPVHLATICLWGRGIAKNIVERERRAADEPRPKLNCVPTNLLKHVMGIARRDAQ